jgi:hypothetical protein
MQTNGAHKNNNDNITTPIFTRLNKTTQKTDAQEQVKSEVLKQMYFNVNDENAITLKYFNSRTYAVYQFQQMNSFLRLVK